MICCFGSVSIPVLQLFIHIQDARRHQELGGRSHELWRYCHELPGGEHHRQSPHKGTFIALTGVCALSWRGEAEAWQSGPPSLGPISSHPPTSAPLHPLPVTLTCAQVQGPELKPCLNLPYLGVTHWHSPSERVFLGSPVLTHTLPSNHKLRTSPHSHLPPYLKLVPSENSPPLPVRLPPFSVSHFLFSSAHTYIHRSTTSLGAGMCRGEHVMEVRQRKAIHHVSQTQNADENSDISSPRCAWQKFL